MLVFIAFTSAVYFAYSTLFGSLAPRVAHAAQIERHAQVNLNIVINQPRIQRD